MLISFSVLSVQLKKSILAILLQFSGVRKKQLNFWKLIFYGNQKVTFFFANICRICREIESFIAGIQIKNCTFYESLLSEEQIGLYSDEFASAKRKLGVF